MGFKKQLSEPNYMQKSANALLVARTNSVIAPIISPVGYDDAGLAVGDALHKKSVTLIRNKHNNTTAESDAYRIFSTNLNELTTNFGKHRKAASVAFKKSPKILGELFLDIPFPKSYAEKLETMDNFYSTLDNNSDYHEKTTPFKLNIDTITTAREKLTAVKLSRSEYTSAVGKTQDSTVAKDEAVAELKEWMDDFFDAAEVILVEHPQLMEALGIVVKR